jgi:hypothetical protein
VRGRFSPLLISGVYASILAAEFSICWLARVSPRVRPAGRWPGSVSVNEVPGYRTKLTPFAGIKASGLGVTEGVVEAIHGMTTVRLYTMPWPWLPGRKHPQADEFNLCPLRDRPPPGSLERFQTPALTRGEILARSLTFLEHALSQRRSPVRRSANALDAPRSPLSVEGCPDRSGSMDGLGNGY